MDKINNGLKSRELYELISLQPEIIEKLEVIGGREDLTQAERYLDGMMDMDTAQQSYRDLKAFFEEDTDQLKMLYCQLECARRLFRRYEEKGDSKEHICRYDEMFYQIHRRVPREAWANVF